jgi:hypothetical protein
MPHLSELARQYAGKVTIISVDVMEAQGSSMPVHVRDKKVDDFVAKMGRDMDYHVARDAEENGYMFTHWMRAAYQMGIPCGFVVDAKGNIAWIGQPSYGLAEALPQILDGTFDYKAETLKVAATQAKNKAQIEVIDDANGTIKAINQLIADQQWQPALAKIEDTQAKHPERANLESFKFQPLLHIDEAKALAMVRANLEKGGTYGVYQAGIIGSTDYLSPETYAFAISILEPALAKAEKPEARTIAGLALAYFNTGKPAKAVATQQKLLLLVNEDNTPPALLARYRENLQKFQAAVKG